MATGRTTLNHCRFYAGGYDLSGYARWFGPLTWEYHEADLTATMGDAVKGYLPDMPTIGVGTLAAVLDTTAGVGITIMETIDSRIVTAPIGIRAAPAAGDPCWCGEFLQLGYHGEESGGAAVINIPFGNWNSSGAVPAVANEKPWGVLLYPKTTPANTFDGPSVNNGAATTNGAVAYLQSFLNTANYTLTIEHSATGAFAGEEATLLTFTEIGANITAERKAVTGDVRQYLRFCGVKNAPGPLTVAVAIVRL